AKDKKTTATRSKEEAHDYRYFPEPDLVKVSVGQDWINKIKSKLPELPEARVKRFIQDYSISESNAEEIIQDKGIADLFESVASNLIHKNEKSFTLAGNIFRVEVKRVLNEKKIEIKEFSIADKILAELVDSISSGNISNTASKEIFNLLLEGKDEAEQRKIFKTAEANLSQVSDNSEIELIVKKILEENPKQVERYRIGEKKLAGFFVGKVMQESKGKANPKVVNEILIKNLEE
ncbi:MAG: Asp-tRNA(Asn)/Glu-tRNA(Gln) amidotransferase GatCAB subunit B, partial [bacterium]